MKRPAFVILAFSTSLAISPDLLQGQEHDEALMLFEQMQDKLAGARTIQTKVIAKVESSGPRQPKVIRNVEAHVVVERGERSRISLAETFTFLDGKQLRAKAAVVSNGKAMAFHVRNYFEPERIYWRRQDIPRDWNASVLDGLVCLDFESGFRVGTIFKADFSISEDRVWTQAKAIPTRFKLGRKEKLGNQEARVIEYHVERSDGRSGRVDHTCIVWLDLATSLPLKRENRCTLYAGEDQRDCRVTETFEYMKLDENVDARKFQLPTDE